MVESLINTCHKLCLLPAVALAPARMTNDTAHLSLHVGVDGALSP
jgi:hypothetical protein